MGTPLGKVETRNGGELSTEQRGDGVEFVYVPESGDGMPATVWKMTDEQVRELIWQLCQSPGVWDGADNERQNLSELLK